MNQAIITRTPMASMRMPMHVSKERIMEVPEPAAKFFFARNDRTGTHLHVIKPDSGNMPAS